MTESTCHYLRDSSDCVISYCMFIRKITQKKKAETYHSYRLVESVRTDKGPRQRMLLNLGGSFNVPSEQWKPLCGIISEKLTGQLSLYSGSNPDLEKIAEGIVKNVLHKNSKESLAENQEETTIGEQPDYATIDLTSLYHNDVRSVGGESLCLEMMGRLGLFGKLTELGFNGNQRSLAIGAIVARLLAPGSERSSFFWLRQQSAIGEMIDFDYNTTSLNRFYEVADQLYAKKDELERWFYQQEREMFSLPESIVLYDLTNTFFEGSGKFNDKAEFGRSKEKRSDAPLVTLGLVLDGDGFIKKSQVFPGNVSEPGTMRGILDKLIPEQKTICEQTVILDAGIATNENLSWLNEHGFKYVVVSREKPEMPEKGELISLTESAKETIQAKLVKNDSSSEWELYVDSPARAGKEKAIKTLFMRRMEDDLTRARDGLSKKNGIKQIEKVHQRIGRIKEKYKRVADLYDIEVATDEEGRKAVDIKWQINSSKESKKLAGIYCLRTNIENPTAKSLWNLYGNLNQVEDAFRSMKSTLGLRPVFHQKEHRVDAHLFITILAYHIMHSILFVLKKAGIDWNWETIRKILTNHVRLTSVLKEKNGNCVHIRKNSVPNSWQKKIYQAMKIAHPSFKSEKNVFDKNANVVTD